MDGLDAAKMGLFFLSTASDPGCFAQGKINFGTAENLELRSNLSIDDLQFEVRSGKKCVAILTIGDRSDLSVIVNGLFTLKKDIRDRKLMVIIFLKFSSVKVEDLLMRSGCSEILKFDVNAKAFTYKINRYLKLLEQESVATDTSVSLVSEKSQALTTESAKKLKPFPVAPQTQDYGIQMTEEWTGTNDFWLFRKKVYAKKYQNRWLIELIGPSPVAGAWEKVNDQHWRWQSRPGYEIFNVAPGTWEFYGNEPQYSWVVNRWAFVSEQPSLGLINRSHVVYSRFQLKNSSVLEVAHNSEYARNIFQKIKDTFDREQILARDQAGSGEMQGKLSSDAEIPWNDLLNSNELFEADWNQHDLSDGEGRDWETQTSVEYLMGAEAMAACGIKAQIKNDEVELLECDEQQNTLTLVLNSELVNHRELVEINLTSENLDLPKYLRLKGVVSQISNPDEAGKRIAIVVMLQSSGAEFQKIREAVNLRQTEVFSFFKKARGLD